MQTSKLTHVQINIQVQNKSIGECSEMRSCTILSSRGKLYLDVDRQGPAVLRHRRWGFRCRAHGNVQGLPAIGVLQLARGGDRHLLHSPNNPAPASLPLHSQQQAPANSSCSITSSKCRQALASAFCRKASAKHASSQQAPTRTCSMRRMMTGKL
jgi:hypothetical protein